MLEYVEAGNVKVRFSCKGTAKIILGVLVLSVPIGMGVVATASGAGAVTDTRYVCLKNTTNKCLDSPGAGYQLQVDNGAKYNIVQVGTVSSSGAWPFKPGSGLNAHYAGEPVYELDPVNNSYYCVYAVPFIPPSGQVGLGTCASPNDLWVGDPNEHLVSVVASDTEVYNSIYEPYVMTAYPGKGYNVFFYREDRIPSGWIDKWGY